MPSKVMDQQALSSSSYFSDQVLFSGERQVGFWKKEITAAGHYVDKRPVASSPREKFMPLQSEAEKILEHMKPFMNYNEKTNISPGMHTGGSGGAGSYSPSLWSPADRALVGRANLGTQLAPYFVDGEKVDMMGSQYEKGLFSSSFSELLTTKLKLSSNNGLLGHSVDNTMPHEDDEPFESLEEMEAQTIGNLLPNDDDLLSGVTDGLDYIIQPGQAEDIEDLDLFSSLGGMDLGDDTFGDQKDSEDTEGTFNGQRGGSSVSVAGEHPLGEHPSRTLFVRNINSDIEDSELQALFKQYGDIRALYTACKNRGFVMISYYDLRAAQNAMRALQSKLLRRRKLDIHYSIPKDNPTEKDINQGTLVVYDLDSSVSDDELRQIFGAYGEIKEIRDASHINFHKVIEFYDIRAAESAFRSLNWTVIAGKQIKLEHGRPGGAKCLMQLLPADLAQNDAGPYMRHMSPNHSMAVYSGQVSCDLVTPGSMNNDTILGFQSALQSPTSPFLENNFHHGTSSSIPRSLSSLMTADSVGSHPLITEPNQSPGHLNFGFRRTPVFRPHSLPEFHDGLINGFPCKSPGPIAPNFCSTPTERIENGHVRRVNSIGHSVELNEGVLGGCSVIGQHYTWNKTRPPQPPGMRWSNSPSFVNGVCAAPSSRFHGVPSAPSHMPSSVGPITNHHVGSAPAVNSSLWERRRAYAGESPEASGFLARSPGNMRINSLHPLDFASPRMFPAAGGNCMDVHAQSKNVGLHASNMGLHSSNVSMHSPNVGMHSPNVGMHSPNVGMHSPNVGMHSPNVGMHSPNVGMHSPNVGLHSPHQRCMMYPARGQMSPMMNSLDSPNERGRSRRSENSSSQAETKKQYELDIDRIMRGEDRRTTLMIKNIPNKYTSKMLLATIDEQHRGTYDFIYLPIDFKNKCNVGYAFINMIDPLQIVPFYQAFNGKKWEKFNSEKVATLAYARIQGKSALIGHFQNSSLMNEDKRCRPILFTTDGPNAGDQVPFPMGSNIRSRHGKSRSSSTEENNQESPSNLDSGEEESSSGESSSGSAKELD